MLNLNNQIRSYLLPAYHVYTDSSEYPLKLFVTIIVSYMVPRLNPTFTTAPTNKKQQIHFTLTIHRIVQSKDAKLVYIDNSTIFRMIRYPHFFGYLQPRHILLPRVCDLNCICNLIKILHLLGKAYFGCCGMIQIYFRSCADGILKRKHGNIRRCRLVRCKQPL